jgi:predicted aconitase with swiveling domain
MKKIYSAKKLIEGKASGIALVSDQAFTFAHGVDPKTGKINDLHNRLKGRSVKKKILFYLYGKGSTTASAWFLETVRLGNEPSGIVTSVVDPASVIGSAVASILYGKNIPVMLWPTMQGRIKTGQHVTIDSTHRKISVEK